MKSSDITGVIPAPHEVNTKGRRFTSEGLPLDLLKDQPQRESEPKKVKESKGRRFELALRELDIIDEQLESLQKRTKLIGRLLK